MRTPEHEAYLEQMLAETTGGRRDPDALRAALTEMATPGWNWEMFTAAGNAACAAALARLLARLEHPSNPLTADQLTAAFETEIADLASLGHLEVGDTEPERHFQDAANLIALLHDWPLISRYDFHAHEPVIDAANQAHRDAHTAATSALIAAHRDEYDRLVATHLGD